MNGRKAKAVRKKAHTLMYEWLHTLVSSKEAEAITKENYLNFFPTLEKYVYHEGTLKLSSFTERWFIQTIKKHLKKKELKHITLQDVM
jgi:hypothetical protein